MKMYYQKIESILGPLYLFTDEFSVREIAFFDEMSKKKKRYSKYELIEGQNKMMKLLITQLREYFSGKRKDFDLPLNYEDGTDFQKKAWKYLASIPYGQTVSYSQQAKKMGHEKAVRAVGTANGHNLIPIILPCHRVLRANGDLGGYAGGLHMKEILLKLESRSDD